MEGLPGLKDFFTAAKDLDKGQPVPAVAFDNGSIVAVIRERVPAHPRPGAGHRGGASGGGGYLATAKARQEAASCWPTWPR